MRSIVDARVRFLLSGLAVIFGLLMVGCSLIAGYDEKATPVVFPFDGAPMTAAVDGNTLVIVNNTESAIYHRVFPTDILPAIEWAPCIAPERCPAEERIDSREEKRIALRAIVGDQTESIIVFWWTYQEKLAGASVPPLDMAEIKVPLP